MSNVFLSKPHGSNPYSDPEQVREMILRELKRTEWASTSNLYAATKNRVKRELLHAVLKAMLDAREIRMRAIPVVSARDRTEFKLMPANGKVRGAEPPGGASSAEGATSTVLLGAERPGKDSDA